MTAPPGPLDQLENPDLKDRLENQGKTGRMEMLMLTEVELNLGLQAHPARLDNPVLKEGQENLERLERLEN